MDEDKAYFKINKTKSGIKYFLEKNKFFPSVLIGVFVKSGSRYEDKSNRGIAHFIEHTVFKGTNKRTAFQISHEIERLGGELNAYTSSEYTLFYTRLLNKHIETGFDILSDILIHPTFDAKLLEMERRVILEEIHEYYDSPQDICQSEALHSIWGDNPIANNPLGNEKSVKAIKREDILEWFHDKFNKENIFISVIGDIDKEKTTYLIEKYFSSILQGNTTKISGDLPSYSFQKRTVKKDSEQVHIAVTLKGEKSFTRKSLLHSIYTTILGGNMSSRLFQKLREESGLVYSVYAYSVQFSDAGGTVIYASALPKNIAKIEGIVSRELDDIRINGVKKEEFQDAKEYILGNLILSLESNSGRMQRNGTQGMFQGKIKSIKSLMKEIESVSFDEFVAFAKELSSSEKGEALVGNVEIKS